MMLNMEMVPGDEISLWSQRNVGMDLADNTLVRNQIVYDLVLIEVLG
jgi:hypothetical protein